MHEGALHCCTANLGCRTPSWEDLQIGNWKIPKKLGLNMVLNLSVFLKANKCLGGVSLLALNLSDAAAVVRHVVSRTT